jgi:hypothetical protein
MKTRLIRCAAATAENTAGPMAGLFSDHAELRWGLCSDEPCWRGHRSSTVEWVLRHSLNDMLLDNLQIMRTMPFGMSMSNIAISSVRAFRKRIFNSHPDCTRIRHSSVGRSRVWGARLRLPLHGNEVLHRRPCEFRECLLEPGHALHGLWRHVICVDVCICQSETSFINAQAYLCPRTDSAVLQTRTSTTSSSRT